MQSVINAEARTKGNSQSQDSAAYGFHRSLGPDFESSQQLLHNLPMHIGQPEIAALETAGDLSAEITFHWPHHVNPMHVPSR